MEGTMGHLIWSRYPLVPLVSRFTIMGDLPSIIKKKIFLLMKKGIYTGECDRYSLMVFSVMVTRNRI